MANFKQYIKTSFQNYDDLPSKKNTGNSYSSHWAQQDIDHLYKKIKDFSRETTQWDLYKITQVVTNQENFQSQVNNLPPYSSAIITTQFIENNETYRAGDLVYKNLDNSTTHISAERGGVFYPSKIMQTVQNTQGTESASNNVDIYFSYMTTEPSEDTIRSITPDSNTWEITDIPRSKTLKYSQLVQNIPTTVYGHVNPKNNTFDAVEGIFPIIKLYNSNNEEVYGDFSLNLSAGKYIISNLPSIVTKVVVK